MYDHCSLLSSRFRVRKISKGVKMVRKVRSWQGKDMDEFKVADKWGEEKAVMIVREISTIKEKS